MRIGTQLRNGVAAVVAGTAALALPAGAAQPADPSFDATPASPRGPATAAATQLAEQLARTIDNAPADYTGVSIKSPTTVQVALPGGPDLSERIRAIREQASTVTGTSVILVTADRSRSAMRMVKARLIAELRAGTYPELIAVGEDPVRGAAVAYVSANSTATRSIIRNKYGAGAVIRPMTAPNLTATRTKDTAPHYGGAGYLRWNAAHTGYRGACSVAFPVIRSGVRYLLTGGHCLPAGGSFRNLWANGFTSASRPSSTYYFGTLHTTTVGGTETAYADATQDRFGDWALIGGSTYSPRVYNCGSATAACSSLPVGSASWTTPVMGAAACTSGFKTTQICRHFVTDPDLTMQIAPGVIAGHLARLQNDKDLDGSYDCVTADHGDSGGAVYQGMASRPGYVRAMGVLTAIGGCSTFYTKLSGVRAAYPTMTMPTL